MSDESAADQRRTIRSIAVQFLLNGFVWATFIPRLPEIRDRVGVSVGLLGLVLTIGNASGLVSSLLTGRVIERWGSRRVMIAGGVLYAAALPIIGMSTSAVALVAGLIALLFFDVFVDVAMNLQGSIAGARRKSPVMSRLHGVWSLGTVAGAGSAAVVADQGISVPTHFSVTAALVVVGLIVVARGVSRGDDRHPDQASVADGTPAARRFKVLALSLGLGSALAVAVDITVGEWAAFRLAEDLSIAGGRAVLGFVAFTTGMTLGRFGGDALTARLGGLRLFRLGACVGFVGLAVASFQPLYPLVLGGFFVTGLGISVLSPQLADAAAQIPGRPGSGLSVLFIGHRSAALMTPLAIGSLADLDRFGIGDAMAILGLPAYVGLALLAKVALSDPATGAGPPSIPSAPVNAAEQIQDRKKANRQR